MAKLRWGSLVLLVVASMQACDEDAAVDGEAVDGGTAGTAGEAPTAGDAGGPAPDAGGSTGAATSFAGQAMTTNPGGEAGAGGNGTAGESSGAGGTAAGVAGIASTGGAGGESVNGGAGGACPETLDVCVVDADWTCETGHDCPGGTCSETDHKCKRLRELNESCDKNNRCVYGLDCDGGVCIENDNVFYCYSSSCLAGEFCREYAIGINGSYCAPIEADYEDIPCISDSNCGPRYYCGGDEHCTLRPEAKIPCLENPNVCGKHYYCDEERGICWGRHWGACTADSCPVHTFCNEFSQCQRLPGLGEHCREGQCDATLKCESQPNPAPCASN